MGKEFQVTCYRYLSSHWYESLRDAEFMVSSPSVFNDIDDCRCLVKNAVSEEVARMLNSYDWIAAAKRHRMPLSAVAHMRGLRFNSVDLTRMCQSGFEKARAIIDYNVRILCLSMAAAGYRTESHMWRKYANDGRGTRIGLSIDISERSDSPMKKVVYSDEEKVLDLALLDHFPITIGEVLPIVRTKSSGWSIESEVRMIRRIGSWQDHGGRSYWHFKRPVVRRVDIGSDCSPHRLRGVVQMLTEYYPWADVYRYTGARYLRDAYVLVRRGNLSTLPTQEILLD